MQDGQFEADEPQPQGAWSSGLFQCMSHGTLGVCVLGCFCPCVAFGENLHQVGLVRNCMAPALTQCCCWAAAGAVANTGLVGAAIAGGLTCAAACQRGCFRQALSRQLFGKQQQEMLCQSVLLEFFCYPCSLAQVRAEIVTHEVTFDQPHIGRGRPSRSLQCARCLGVIPSVDNLRFGRGVQTSAPFEVNYMAAYDEPRLYSQPHF